MVRDILPSCWFDKTYCERGIDTLMNYRYEYNSDRDAYNQKPHHDWASNGSDAFRQFAQGYKTGGAWGAIDKHIDKSGPIRERHKSKWNEQNTNWVV